MEKFAIEREKVGIIIGKKGATKKLLEYEIGVKITISRTGNIKINGSAIKSLVAMNVIKAICFGFLVDDALQLINPDFIFEIISVKDFAKSKSRIKEIKARIIGRKGKAKKTIESLGNIFICVSKTKIGIIGSVEEVFSAKEAIESLLRGAKHGRIYKWMENKSRYNKREKRESLEF
ncbi:MAG: KH domain-containing protein [Nanoarchaeota archaeon]|nr:KH domain-containing protein [Nanoarchaeota archaeon]